MVETALRLLTPLGLAGLMCAAVPAFGQTADDAAVGEQPRRYRIELLVFRNLNPIGVEEVWIPEPLPQPRNEQDMEPAADAAFGDTLPPPAIPRPSSPGAAPARSEQLLPVGEEALPLSFAMVPATELELTPLAERMVELNDYEPIVHIGWIQLGYPESQAIPFHLTGLDVTRQLSGTATFWVARYPHLRLNLQMLAEPAAFASGTSRVFRIEERRRVRREERHYFDNPQFGVIAVVRYAEDAAASAPVQPGA